MPLSSLLSRKKLCKLILYTGDHWTSNSVLEAEPPPPLFVVFVVVVFVLEVYCVLVFVLVVFIMVVFVVDIFVDRDWVNLSKRGRNDRVFLRLAGQPQGISQGQSLREIPRSSPASPRKTLPVLPDSFSRIYILFPIGFRIGPP